MTAFAPRRGLPALPRPLMRVAALVSAAFLAACDPVGTGVASGPQTGPVIDPSQPVPVALLVPGGSGNPELDRIARSIVNSARMAASDAQGARIDLRVYDTGADAPAAVEGANRAVAEGAQIIVGPLHAESANAVGQAMAGRVNVLAFSNNADIAGGNVFVLGNTFYNTADRLIGYGVAQGKRRVLVVAEDDVSGQAGAAAIEAAIARNRATLTGKAVHPISEQGIDGIVPQVVAIAQQRQADAIFMTANSPAVLPYLTGALADRGVTSDTAQFIGLTRWDVPAARMQLPGVQGGWFAVPDLPRIAEFSQRYQRSYGETPHELGALGYDAVSAIASLVRAGRSDALTTAGLTSGSGFQGISGVFRLRPDGTNQRGLAVATIRGGQLTIVDPAPRGFSGAGF